MWDAEQADEADGRNGVGADDEGPAGLALVGDA